MEPCVFCRIVKGELPSYKVYDDTRYYGFLDIRPLNRGNSLLIPKKHYRWVYDVPSFGQYWETAKKIALATQSVVNSRSITFLTIGEEVPHAHIRIIPRFENDGHVDGISMNAVKNIAPADMRQLAQKIYAAVNA